MSKAPNSVYLWSSLNNTLLNLESETNEFITNFYKQQFYSVSKILFHHSQNIYALLLSPIFYPFGKKRQTFNISDTNRNKLFENIFELMIMVIKDSWFESI